MLLQVIESILDDDNDMQDMYLGRRAAVEALAKQQVQHHTQTSPKNKSHLQKIEDRLLRGDHITQEVPMLMG